MYKLIALDMDGTLLNSNKEISKENYEAIKKARENGVKVVLATGRPVDGVKKYLEELDMVSDEEYVAAYNGAVIQNGKSGDIISKIPLNLDCYKELYELSKELEVNIHALTEKGVTTPKYNEYTEVEATINEIPLMVEEVSDIDENETIIKVMFIDDPKKLDDITDKIPEHIKEKYTVVRTYPIFLEFLDKRVDKAFGVKTIAENLNIKQEEIICVGDAGNDLGMVKYAGLGVAMDNAFDEVKEIANYVTLSNDNHGVAHVIEKFILNMGA
ncbi:sugar-phosphatase [Anaeromicrobium sediminis]|uniref:Sugar-phosphatase n=1 Tax=Anaeromicrobium sediminis TaxID=1478221 RepID=A0A267MLK6_9FIRM|nr:sugar-phosphatase [Anaeromicrobium sediminis]PAB60469.1 sugar-phosphatase [Anaeromicrobium sediminis]